MTTTKKTSKKTAKYDGPKRPRGRPRKEAPAEPQPLKKPTVVERAGFLKIEKDWLKWQLFLFPNVVTHPPAPHHVEFWEWAWSIKKGVRPRPYLAVWPRGGGKSQSVEMAIVGLGARGIRRYCVYVSDTQERADQHVQSIAEMLESEEIALWYPDIADRALSKFGTWKGWRRNRLHTRAGFIIDALGLDVAARGMKVGSLRPDMISFDDLDEDVDTPETTAKKIQALTRRILPATTNDAVVIGIQNLIHSDSIFAQLVDGRATFLADRIVSGPIPAIENLTYETREDEQGRFRHIITGGTPTWDGLDIQACQNEITKEGIDVFLAELQHQTPELTGGMFDEVTFRHCTLQHYEEQEIDRVVCWVDPAVTDNDESDSMGIQVDALARDGTVYRVWSWEKRADPLQAIQLAITQAFHYGASYVGIETDQGGLTWGSVFREARDALGAEYSHITMRSRKAGQGRGNKVHRASTMLAEYMRGMIVHVEGTHYVLEAALLRFPRRKPLDLVDAAAWSHSDLRMYGRPARAVAASGSIQGRQGARGVVRKGAQLGVPGAILTAPVRPKLHVVRNGR